MQSAKTTAKHIPKGSGIPERVVSERQAKQQKIKDRVDAITAANEKPSRESGSFDPAGIETYICTGTCRRSLPVVKFPTVAAGRRGSECRECRDARRVPRDDATPKPDRQKTRDAAAAAIESPKSPSGGATKAPAKVKGMVKKQTPGSKARAAAKPPVKKPAPAKKAAPKNTAAKREVTPRFKKTVGASA